jgi:XTP/dITP diphosphohydrolase
MADAMRILLASNNPKKRLEIERVLAPLGVAVVSPADLCLDLHPEETGATFADNARLKAQAFTAASGLPALADDSGLEVAALGGAPGVRSARFAGEDAGDKENRTKLLSELEGVPPERRQARFSCALVLIDGEKELASVQGTCDGIILDEERGTGGFGYDPLFFHPESGKTFAELDPADKDRVSHRGKALRALVEVLEATTRG